METSAPLGGGGHNQLCVCVCVYTEICVLRWHARGEIPALADDEGYEDLVMCGHLSQFLGQVVVLHLPERIELFVIVDGDDGDAAGILQVDHSGRCFAHDCGFRDQSCVAAMTRDYEVPGRRYIHLEIHLLTKLESKVHTQVYKSVCAHPPWTTLTHFWTIGISRIHLVQSRYQIDLGTRQYGAQSSTFVQPGPCRSQHSFPVTFSPSSFKTPCPSHPDDAPAVAETKGIEIVASPVLPAVPSRAATSSRSSAEQDAGPTCCCLAGPPPPRRQTQ